MFAAGAFLLVALLPNKNAGPVTSPSAGPNSGTRVQLMPSPSQGNAGAAPSVDPGIAGPVVNRYGAFSIQRSADSHFYADADVNGVSIRFLIDTGATSVVLSPEDAERAGIGGGSYSQVGEGVGGKIALMPAKADRLNLGTIMARDVPVMVAKERLPVSLLGQSYLSSVGTVSIRGDVMTLQ